MKTRLLPGIAVALLAVFVLVRPSSAQEEAEADTIYVSGDKTIIIVDEDGERIIVRGIGDVDWPRIFVDDDLISPHTFRVRPGQFRMPRVEFRGRHFDDEDDDDDEQDFVFFDSFAGDLDHLLGEGFGGDFTIRLGESMKERQEIRRLEMESHQLARQVRRADDDERAQLEQELAEKLNEIFDRKQALREKRVEQLREAMNKALDEQNDREANRNEIIDRRLRELLGQRDRYDW